MKNRKILIGGILCAAALCVGVGYAAVTDVLNINGTANVAVEKAQEAFDEQIYFSNAQAAHASDSAEITANNDVVTFTCSSLKAKDDSATFTFTVRNAGDLSPTVVPSITSATNSEYFSVTHNWGTGKVVNANSTEDIVVTVSLLKTPTVTQEMSCAISLTATAGE